MRHRTNALLRLLANACLGMGLLVAAGAAPAVEPGTPIPAGSLQAPVTRFEFAVYFAGPAPADAMARLQALRAKLPDAPALVAKLPDRPDRPVLAARLDLQVESDYAPPDAALLQRFGQGLTQADSLAVMKSTSAMILDFAHPGARSLPALRSASVLTEQFARATHGFIWDEGTREVLSPDAWHERRIASWSNGVPDVSRQVVVHAYDHGGSLRAISLGMGKFGLPDVVLPRFTGTLIRPMGDLVDLVLQSLVEGVQPGRAGELDVDARALRHEARRAAILARMREGATVARLAVTVARAEDGDPPNRLMALSAARYPGADDAQRLAALSRSLYDARDDVLQVRETDELKSASEAARRQLPALHELFNRGLRPGEFIRVKAPFRTDTGGREWMWVEVQSWNGDTIGGMLANEPGAIAQLHSGQHVTVSQAELFDWLHVLPDGRREGDLTDAIIGRLDRQQR